MRGGYVWGGGLDMGVEEHGRGVGERGTPQVDRQTHTLGEGT